MNSVRPEYFSTVRIPLVAGHGFDAGSEERNEVIVNEGLAKRFWPASSPIGHRFRLKLPVGLGDAAAKRWMTVVGETPNVVVHGLSDDPRGPFYYVPSQSGVGFGGFTLIVRTQHGANVAPALRRLSLSISKSMEPPALTAVATAFDSSIATQRFTTVILTTFAILAVVLAAIGLFGVISYTVAQRTREIGIRIALGATAAHVARAVAASGLALSALGLLIGLSASIWGTRLIQTALFGVGTTDLVSFGAAALLLLGVSVVACLVPMRRAMRVDPLVAIRAD
jgi:putative ABC transport system permease protein